MEPCSTMLLEVKLYVQGWGEMAFFFLEIKCASNGLILLHLCIKRTTSFNTTPSVYIILSSVRKKLHDLHTQNFAGF